MMEWKPGIYRPARYHGKSKRPPFFERWYYKIVDRHQKERVAVIPGILKHSRESFAFIRIMDAVQGKTKTKSYPLHDCRAKSERFEMVVGASLFTDRLFSLNVSGIHDIKGELMLRGIQPWPVRWYSPGAMGPFAFLPFMPRYHAVLSMDHELEGNLILGGREIDFTGGRGYVDKEWGRAFPEAWIRMQSNHFETAGTSFCALLTKTLWMRRPFRSLIAALLHEGKWVPFTTYQGGSVTDLRIYNDYVIMVLRQDSWDLEILAERSEDGGLMVPLQEAFTRLDQKCLNGEIRLRLSRKHGRRRGTVFEGTGTCAVVETGGYENENSLSPGFVEEPATDKRHGKNQAKEIQ
ncbi:MAG TPA: hypothetical protein ENN03_09170 [bacterium]|nr:hypothetical protein [bacterium]